MEDHTVTIEVTKVLESLLKDDLGLRNAQIARDTGIGEANLWKVWKGERNLTMRILSRIIETYDLGIDIFEKE